MSQRSASAPSRRHTVELPQPLGPEVLVASQIPFPGAGLGRVQRQPQPLLAPAQRLDRALRVAVGALQARTHFVERIDDLVELVRLSRWAAVQLQRRRRLANVVAAHELGEGTQVPGEEAEEDVDAEERDEEGLRALTDQDEQGNMRELAVELGEGRLDIEDANLPVGFADAVEDGVFPADHRLARAALCGGHDGGAGRGLADLGGADVGETQYAVELQLQLLLIQSPQTLAEAGEIAVPDVFEPALDGPDAPLVLEHELERRQAHRQDPAEYEDDREEPEGNAAAEARKESLRCAEPRQKHSELASPSRRWWRVPLLRARGFTLRGIDHIALRSGTCSRMLPADRSGSRSAACGKPPAGRGITTLACRYAMHRGGAARHDPDGSREVESCARGEPEPNST